MLNRKTISTVGVTWSTRPININHGKGVDGTGIDIIVTHYKAPWEVGEALFDSIANQRGIDFKDVGVILVNDGEGNDFDLRYIAKKYPFSIEQVTIPHSGVSTARNTGLDKVKREFCMICDFDDSFYSVYGLYRIMQMCKDGVNLVVGRFLEEVIDENGLHLIEHKDDRVFIHGKAYRTEWLRENNLRFDPEICLHEDVYFEMLVRSVAEREGSFCVVPETVYLWKWYEGSVTRTTKNFTLSTYDELMKSRTALIRELKKRGFKDEVKMMVAKTTFDAYYDSQKSILLQRENKGLVETLEKAFARFFRDHADVYAKTDPQFLAAVAQGARQLAYGDGLMMEHQTFTAWVDHLIKDIKLD